MPATLQRQPPRFRLTLGARDFGEVTLAEARDIRDVCDTLIVRECDGSEIIITLTCLHFGIPRQALEPGHPRGQATVANPRLVAMALVKEYNPLLTDRYVASLFGRERSTCVHARNWVRDREQTCKHFAQSLAQLRGQIVRRLEGAQP